MPDAKFCYVILCHTDSKSVLRLARRIRELSPRSSVLLRHDQDNYITQAEARAVGADLLHSRTKINWGGWSMVRATVEAWEHARRTNSDFYVLLSGQDYPVRDLQIWEDEVVVSGDDALIASMDTPVSIIRHQYYWAEPFRAPSWIPALVDRGAAFAVSRLDRVTRPAVRLYRNRRDLRWTLGVRRISFLPGGRPPFSIHKGSQWVTLSLKALDVFLATYRDDSISRRFFSRTQVPDEIYLQSILHNHADLRVADRNTTYNRFLKGDPSPLWVNKDDVIAAVAAGTPFVRKVKAEAEEVRSLADSLSNPAGAD